MDRNGDYDIGMAESYEKEDAATKRSVQNWLVYEDQTIGYAEIADLANQGKSADQIRSTIDEASKAYNGIRESGRHVVEQVAHKYLPENSKVDYETEAYIKNKLGSKELESLFDLDYVWGDSYYRSKLDPFIESCVKEAAIKRKSRTKNDTIVKRIIKDNNNYQSQRAAQLAVQEANRAASLGITGGTNPYMFG